MTSSTCLFPSREAAKLWYYLDPRTLQLQISFAIGPWCTFFKNCCSTYVSLPSQAWSSSQRVIKCHLEHCNIIVAQCTCVVIAENILRTAVLYLFPLPWTLDAARNTKCRGQYLIISKQRYGRMLTHTHTHRRLLTVFYSHDLSIKRNIMTSITPRALDRTALFLLVSTVSLKAFTLLCRKVPRHDYLR